MNSAPEMSWWVWCLLFAAGASALAALSVAAAQVLSLRVAWAISAMRQSKIKALFLLVFVIGMIQYGATKGTNGNSPSVCASSRSVQDSTLLISPVAYDSDSLYAGGSPVTNFMFCGIERYPESVLLALAWPDSFSFINNRIDLYCHWCLTTNNWSRIAQIDLSNSSSNAVIELPDSILPTNALCKAAFFIAADQSDSDGDGLSDTFEKIVSGSGPAFPDTDGDGVFDGEEIRLGTECTAVDSDTDGLSDAEELGTVTVLPPTETWWRYFGGESEVWSSSYYGSSGSFVVNLPCPYTVNGVVYSQIRVCVDGLIYLLSPENPQWGFIEQISIPPQLSATLLSSKHIAIAGFGADLYVRAKTWGSKLCYGSTDISSGRASVIEFCDFGFASDVISGAMNLFTFQLILPSDEPNVFYLTYRPIPSSYYASNNPTIGVQCPMLNPRTQNEAYYNLTLSPSDSFFSSMRTVRFFIGCGTDPQNADTDGDGFSDGEEVAVLKTDPNASDEDSDNDGLPDAVEILIGSNAERFDTDYDGLSDLEEFSLGLNILQPDTDGDGMNDGWENRYADIGFDPALDNSADVNLNNDPYADMDSDGLPNSEECGHDTNPGVPDTDGDGVSDAVEINQLSDPVDASDSGFTNSSTAVSFIFGDHSESHSEKYRLLIIPVEGCGEMPKRFSWLNENYGECETKTAFLKPGWKYEVRLDHAGTNNSDRPDYDYTLTHASVSSNVVITDSESLFGIDNTSSSFSGEGKIATIAVYKISSVKICCPDNSVWDELEDSRVILDDEAFKIKIEIEPQLQSLAQCGQIFGGAITVKTSETCPAGTQYSVENDAIFYNESGRSVICISKTRQQLMDAGILPTSDEDGVNEMAWMDMADLSPGSGQNLSDSKAFAELNFENRGECSRDTSKSLISTPPNSIPSDSYFKAAGREIISASYGEADSNKKQIMNQADWFYFSGHGSHATGMIQGGFTPSMATKYWNRDMNCVIIAGCAVLDVQNYRFNSLGLLYRWKHRDWKGAYPGERWEESGVKFLLGYALKAPLDTDGGSLIASAFIANIKSGKDVITSWRDANDIAKGRNACVIDCSRIPHQFWFWDESTGSPIWTKKEKGVVSW